MDEDIKKFEEVRSYWNDRAGLGAWAGSKDLIAKQLEITAISSYVRDGMNILEIGCGNGITAIELAKLFDVTITAFDYADDMIAAANAFLTGNSLKGSVTFHAGDVLQLPAFNNHFDLIYTERVLINLPDWESQRKAIIGITKLLKPGGVYVMCENSQDGLDQINSLRSSAALGKITPPWHNRYFRDDELSMLTMQDAALESINYYSSTYYFLSRVVNAWVAAQNGEEPKYDAQLNYLALQLPSLGNWGQGRIWLWRKN